MQLPGYADLQFTNFQGQTTKNYFTTTRLLAV
jgi:hypothetical protein